MKRNFIKILFVAMALILSFTIMPAAASAASWTANEDSMRQLLCLSAKDGSSVIANGNNYTIDFGVSGKLTAAVSGRSVTVKNASGSPLYSKDIILNIPGDVTVNLNISFRPSRDGTNGLWILGSSRGKLNIDGGSYNTLETYDGSATPIYLKKGTVNYGIKHSGAGRLSIGGGSVYGVISVVRNAPLRVTGGYVQKVSVNRNYKANLMISKGRVDGIEAFNGSIVISGGTVISVYSSCKIKVTNGSIKGSLNGDTVILKGGKIDGYVYGKNLKIYKGTVITNDNDSYYDGYYNYSRIEGNNVKIYGGTIKSNVRAEKSVEISGGRINGSVGSENSIKVSGGSIDSGIFGDVIKITGGKINNDKSDAVSVSRKLTVTGGTIKGVYGVYADDDYEDNVTIIISGAKTKIIGKKAGIYKTDYCSCNLTIKGGAKISATNKTGSGVLFEQYEYEDEYEMKSKANISKSSVSGGKNGYALKVPKSTSVTVNGKKITSKKSEILIKKISK